MAKSDLMRRAIEAFEKLPAKEKLMFLYYIGILEKAAVGLDNSIEVFID